MIPSNCKGSLCETKLYIGRLSAVGYEDTCEIINEALLGENKIEVELSVEENKSGYEIVASEGKIEITAGKGGVYEAFSTLYGRIEKDEKGTFIREFSEKGEPRFCYRGVHFDVARHFFKTDEVKKLLDLMFKTKMNVFHWHLSDDQGFRLQLKDFPELEKSTMRSYSTRGSIKNQIREDKPHGGYYTESEVKDVLAYAKARGIEVIPEIDIPGHLTAILAAHPEFTCRGEELEVLGRYGIIENVLCLGNDKAIEFIERLLDAICELFKPRRFHLGFDEVKLEYLDACEKCKAKIAEYGLKNAEELKAKMREHFRDYMLKKGITPIFWNDGMAAADDKCICQHWKMFTDKKTARWINEGQRTIISNFLSLYADYPFAMTPLKKTYGFKPIFKGVKRPENVLGIETALWTEWVEDHDKIAFNYYYRLAAAAEIAYNGDSRAKYEDFMATLRQNEEFLFGERLDIPEEILNPKHRIKKIKEYMRDSYCEVAAWKEGLERKNEQ